MKLVWGCERSQGDWMFEVQCQLLDQRVPWSRKCWKSRCSNTSKTSKTADRLLIWLRKFQYTNSSDLLSDWRERVWALSVRNRLLETKSQNWHLKSCPSLLLCVVNLRVFNAMGTAFFSTPIFKGLAGLLLLTAVFVVLASTTSRTFSVPAPPPLPPERQFSGTGSPTSTFGLARGSFPDSWLGVPPRPYPPDGVM